MNDVSNDDRDLCGAHSERGVRHGCVQNVP